MTKQFVFLALLLSTGIAAADQPTAPNPPAAPAAPMTVAAPATPAVDESALTPAQLGEMLRDLGYEAKDVSVGGKQDIYLIESERNGWKLFIEVSLSTDRKCVWFDVKFKPLADATVAPPAAWLKLLELTRTYHPTHFSLDKNNRIHVSQAIPNSGLDATFIRQEIENFDDIVRVTVDHWKADAFAGK